MYMYKYIEMAKCLVWKNAITIRVTWESLNQTLLPLYWFNVHFVSKLHECNVIEMYLKYSNFSTFSYMLLKRKSITIIFSFFRKCNYAIPDFCIHNTTEGKKNDETSHYISCMSKIVFPAAFEKGWVIQLKK